MKMRKYWSGNVQRFIWLRCTEGRLWIFYRPRKANCSQYPRDITVLPALTLSCKRKSVSKSCHQTAGIIIRHSKIVFVYRHILMLLFKYVYKFAKSDYQLCHVRLSSWNNSAPTGRIFVKHLNIFRKSVAKIKLSIKSEKYTAYFTGRLM